MIFNKYIKAKQNIKITAFGEKKKFATKYQRVKPTQGQGQQKWPQPGLAWPLDSVGRGI